MDPLEIMHPRIADLDPVRGRLGGGLGSFRGAWHSRFGQDGLQRSTPLGYKTKILERLCFSDFLNIFVLENNP